MAFADWSTSNAANTTVGAISIAENCPAANVNNALREIMAEIRVAFNPALDPFHASVSVALARTALGALSSAGDTISGNLIFLGAGPHLHHTNPAFGSGRVFYTAVGASDPTSLAGDIWITGS